MMRAQDPHVTSDAWHYLNYQDVPTIASLFAVEPLERAAAIDVIRYYCGEVPPAGLEAYIHGERDPLGADGFIEADYSRFSTFTRVWYPPEDDSHVLVQDTVRLTFGQPESTYDWVRDRLVVMEMEAHLLHAA